MLDVARSSLKNKNIKISIWFLSDIFWVKNTKFINFFATNLSRNSGYNLLYDLWETHALKFCEACICFFISGQPTTYPSDLVTVVHLIAPGSNQQVAAGNQQPIFVAQQQTSVAQQPQMSSEDAVPDREINNKQQEAINAAKNAAFNEPQRENPPSYFDDQWRKSTLRKKTFEIFTFIL